MCGGSDTVKRTGRFGSFWGCSRYPDCRGTQISGSTSSAGPSLVAWGFRDSYLPPILGCFKIAAEGMCLFASSKRMGKPTSLLEGLCGHALSLGTQSIEVEYKDGREWVFANQGGIGIGIANYAGSSADGKELGENLRAAAKKPVRTVIGGQLYILKVSVFESFGEDAFSVSIDRAPKLDPSIAPSFTARQGQYLAFIYNYTKIHRRAPSESDLERYFQVSPPAIHEMIKTLERNGLIERTPGQARSIRLLLQPEHLPRLD